MKRFRDYVLALGLWLIVVVLMLAGYRMWSSIAPVEAALTVPQYPTAYATTPQVQATPIPSAGLWTIVYFPNGVQATGPQVLNTVITHYNNTPDLEEFYRWEHSYLDNSIIEGLVWVRSADMPDATAGFSERQDIPNLLMIGCTEPFGPGTLHFRGGITNVACISYNCQLVVQPQQIYR